MMQAYFLENLKVPNEKFIFLSLRENTLRTGASRRLIALLKVKIVLCSSRVTPNLVSPIQPQRTLPDFF